MNPPFLTRNFFRAVKQGVVNLPTTPNLIAIRPLVKCPPSTKKFPHIYYDIAELKKFYRERFAEIKYFIAPDYSLCGDINFIENLHRLFRARVVSVWLTLELNAIVIPNITYSTQKIFPYMLEGMENCETVAFSTKGLRNNGKALSLMKKALKYTVDNLKKLRTIIIYTLSKDDNKIHSWFDYSVQHDIKLIIPANRSRKLIRQEA